MIKSNIKSFNVSLIGSESYQELYEISLKEFGYELIQTQYIDISSSNLTEFPKCIQFFVNLKYLYCMGNNLTSIDVSKNVNLQHLNCIGNSTSFVYAGCYTEKHEIDEFRSKMNDYIRLQKLNNILNY